MLARELPEHLRLGTLEGHFRCRWRVSKSGNTLSIVARQRSSKRLRSRMAAVGRIQHRWDTTRPMMVPKPIVPPKARMITFYKNGDPFHSGTKVSIMPGKDFISLDSLCDYLTQRMNIPHGVRYIFSLTGRKISHLDDLLDGYSYVVSGTKNFQEMAYGQSGRMRAAVVSRAHLPLAIRREDLKLYRPLSPQEQRSGKEWRLKSPKNLRSRSLPTQNEGKTITVVNSQNPTVFSRVLLNLRTTQSFEEIVQDLGQAIRLPQAKRLYNQTGDEVRSFSQLKHELKKCETFYIDSEEANNNIISSPDKSVSDFFSMDLNEHDLQPSTELGLIHGGGSLPNLSENLKDEAIPPEPAAKLLDPSASPVIKANSPHTRKPLRTSKGHGNRDKSHKTGKKAQEPKKSISSPPTQRLELTWVHGYHGLDPGRNLFLLSSGEIAYYVGAIAVLHNYANQTQRHYLGHTEDILCMALHTHDDVLATGQGSGMESKAQAHIRVWRADNLTTLAVLGQGRLESDIIGAVFSWEGSLMMLLEGYQDTSLSLWDWQNDIEVTRVTTGQSVLGGAFHPLEEDILVTYGRQHLAFWLKEPNGTLTRQDPLSAGRSGTSFLSMEFLSDGRLVTGNSRGFITVWAPSEDKTKIFFLQKEFKAHVGDVTALLALPEGVLVSGSNTNDENGEIHVWDTSKKFASLANSLLPDGSGGVVSLCPQKTVTTEWEVFVGTNKNVIFEGSVMWALNPVVHGHCDDVRALTCHPDKPCFVTAGLDRYICKWEISSLVWKVQSDSECYSVTIHPHGSIVAVGDEHGDVTFLNMEDGLHVTTLPVTHSPLYTLKYSPDGDTLAVGCADGNIYLFQTHSNGYMYKIDFVLQGNVPILMLDWSLNGEYLQAVFTDSDYHDIVFWDLKKREKVHTVSQLKELEWHKPNCTLGYKINDLDSNTNFWDVSADYLPVPLTSNKGMWNNQHIPDAVHVCCNVSNSKDLLAAGDKNGFIRLFRYPSTSEKAAYYEEKQCSTDVNAICFFPDDQYLVSTGGPDGAICVWKLSSVDST